jgi:hypothetical protein
MQSLIDKLNNRFERAKHKISEQFIFDLCDYLDLFFIEPSLKEIMEYQKTLPQGHYQSIRKEYNKLITEVYEPVQKNPEKEAVKKLFPSFYHRHEEDRERFFLIFNPFTWRAGWLRLVYTNNLVELHKRILISLENKSVIKSDSNSNVEIIATPTQPSKLRTSLGLAPETKWSDITIKFNNAYDIEVVHKSKSYQSNHEELGFKDNRKDNEPKQSWQFLQILSMNSGTYPMQEYMGKTRTAKEKDKQFLASNFKDIFGIDDDPFEPFNSSLNDYYKIKVNLIPEKDFRPDFRDRDIFTDE